MTTLDELTTKLREIFQIDRPDLDFGIYRIMNSRAKDMDDYLRRRACRCQSRLSGGE